MTGDPILVPTAPVELIEAQRDRAAWDRGIPLVAGGLDDQPAHRLLLMLEITG